VCYSFVLQCRLQCIADRPVRPTITGCVVDNWSTMNCSWEPAQQDTGIATTQQLTFWILLVFVYVLLKLFNKPLN